MTLPVTLTVAGTTALLILWLAARVSMLRRARGIVNGDGGDETMRARVRAHANLVEYAPAVLILLALLELAGRDARGLWAAGAVFLAGRLLHPFGLERPGANAMRAGGILSTWAVLGVLAVWAIATAYAAPSAT